MSGQEPVGGDDISAKLLSVYGREPLLPDEREYKTWSANGTCFAYAIATWCFLTGGYAASLVGAVQGMVCLIAGNLIGVDVTGRKGIVNRIRRHRILRLNP